MKFILGKKVEMSQIFDEKGNVIPVTLIKAGPCKISQIKNIEKDGYVAVQLGFDKKKKISSALKGHLQKLGQFRWLREFKIGEVNNLKRGDVISVGTFVVGDKIKITGISKGKGFQGVVKRHRFHGGPASHGHKDQLRMPGSIGATEPARVFKGMRMAGHMGNEKISVKNLEIIKIDLKNNVLYVKGSVPGKRGSMVMISAEGEFKVNIQNSDSKIQEEGIKNEKKDKEIKHEGKKKTEEIDNKVVEEKIDKKDQFKIDKEETKEKK